MPIGTLSEDYSSDVNRSSQALFSYLNLLFKAQVSVIDISAEVPKDPLTMHLQGKQSKTQIKIM